MTILTSPPRFVDPHGSNELHNEPTPNRHIFITQNADMGDYDAWYDVRKVDDFQPHSVRTDKFATTLQERFDGAEVVNHPISHGFQGGTIFFSRSMGWATNHHLFEDVHILHQCQETISFDLLGMQFSTKVV